MLTAHILSFGFVVGITAVSDKDAIDWFLGRKQVLDRSRVQLYHALVWLGLAALIVTGAIMFWPMRTLLLADPLFVMKLLFVGILLVNAILIGRLMHVTFEKPYAHLTHNEKIRLIASGAISFFSWASAGLLAFVIF